MNDNNAEYELFMAGSHPHRIIRGSSKAPVYASVVLMVKRALCTAEFGVRFLVEAPFIFDTLIEGVRTEFDGTAIIASRKRR